MKDKEGRKETGQEKGWIDIHAHILPGMDDGASNWDETVKMIDMARRQGTGHIIATPHYRCGQDLDKLKERMKQLKDRAYSVSDRMTVSLGQEILYFEELPLFLEQKKALTLSGSRYVLVEFLPMDTYSRVFRAVRCLVQASYLPVIAHAERYPCLRKKGRTEELADGGAYLQVNAGSLDGGMFHRDAVWCRKEILKGGIHFLATDMHGILRRPPDMEGAASWLGKKDRGRQDGDGLAQRLLRLNQEHILNDTVL